MRDTAFQSAKLLIKRRSSVNMLQQKPQKGSESTSGNRQKPIEPIPIAAVEFVLQFEASSGNRGRIERRECAEGEQTHEKTADEVFVSVRSL